jgi:hypothetical protein
MRTARSRYGRQELPLPSLPNRWTAYPIIVREATERGIVVVRSPNPSRRCPRDLIETSEIATVA